nr:1910_t:CDS:2 [Entrophospora candida]
MTRQPALPGPFPLPFVGNLFERDLSNLAKKCHKKYGDIFELYIGNQRTIWLCRADLVEKIYTPSTNSNFKLRNKDQQGLDEMGLTHGITMNNDLESWSFNRKFLVNASLSPKFLKNFTIDLVKDSYLQVENYWNIINSEFKNNKMVTGGERNDDTYHINLSSWLSRLSMDISLRTMTVRLIHNHLMNNNNYLRKHLIGVIKERRKEIETMDHNDKILQNDMLTCLININTERDLERKTFSEDDEHYNEYTRPMTDNEISEIVLEVLAANQDTVTRLIDEILSIFPPYSTSIDSINYENIKKLKFLDAFIYEVSRISPSVPCIMRTSMVDDTISGYKFPGNTSFYTYFSAIHMHPKHWTNPEMFNPDRFLDNNGGRGIEKNSFLQFGGGVRICPGRHYAMLFIKIFLVMFFRNGNDFELAYPDKPIKTEYSFAYKILGLMIKVKKRDLQKEF